MPSFFRNITIDDVGYVKLPVGDTSQRPGNTQNGQMRFNSDRGIPEFRDNAQAEWKRQNALSQVVATGGDAVYDIAQFGKKYRVHVFTQDGAFTVSKGGEVEYLVLAGGGAGGSAGGSVCGAGGGAGGLLQGTKSLSVQSYSITVGEGGASVNGSDEVGNKGDNSSALGETAIGGGGGGGNSSQDASKQDGGSGGGGRESDGVGGSGIAGQGNGGADGSESGNFAGGGGGAGAAGNQFNPGIGIASAITGNSLFYAGGGASNEFEGIVTSGAFGGGGDSGGDGGDGDSGTVNTGGGGGGSRANTNSGAGGSGIVVARYEIRDEEQLTPADQDITEGLVLDLDFAKPTVYTGSGSTVSDSRLFPIEGDLIGGVSYINPKTHRAAFDFDGSNGHINIGSLSKTLSSFSFTVWSELDIVDGNTMGIRVIDPSTGAEEISFLLSSGGAKPRFLDSANGIDFTGGSVNTDIFHFICVAADNQSVSLFVDGVEVASVAQGVQPLSNSYSISIGEGGFGGGTNYLNGRIALARIYNSKLTTAQIQNLYNLTRWRFGV